MTPILKLCSSYKNKTFRVLVTYFLNGSEIRIGTPINRVTGTLIMIQNFNRKMFTNLPLNILLRNFIF